MKRIGYPSSWEKSGISKKKKEKKRKRKVKGELKKDKETRKTESNKGKKGCMEEKKKEKHVLQFLLTSCEMPIKRLYYSILASLRKYMNSKSN